MQIELDVIESEKQLHIHLAKKLGFPDFYGQNWDAFWDSITGLVVLPEEIHFKGTEAFKIAFPNAYRQLRRCFDDLNAEIPSIVCKVFWE